MRMTRRLSGVAIAASACVVGAPSGLTAAQAQMPLPPIAGAGSTVTPAFEGWYENPDGSYTLSFGYFNRNREEVLDIPVGEDNFMSPGEPDQGQPTHFAPRRHWGVFTIRVPADFGQGRVVWTLRMRGQTFAIPGSLKPDWKIDALAGEAGSGNTPPALRLSPDGAEGQGPAGVWNEGPTARVGEPVTLRVWARDDGRPSGNVARGGEEGDPVSITWFKHQGPGNVTFSDPTAEVVHSGGEARTQATFDRPGTYVVRIRANDASGVVSAGHAQCCWTNAFLKVTVTS